MDMNWKEMGWECYAGGQTPDSSYGRVSLASRERFIVWTEQGEAEAVMSGHLRHVHCEWPCVGDWVSLREGNVIADILPRRTKLSRKEAGKGIREQVLAANIDVLFVVSGLDREYNPRRLERYLVLAHESGARPIILLNKADLRSDVEDVLHLTKEHTPGVRVLALSALIGWGLEEISNQIEPGETAALIGSSGTGKSTIVNRLLGEERQRTTAVRESDSRGRHTTTCRELIVMPQKWLLIDLPGLRELQLWADPEQIDHVFSDILELAKGCKFRDCTHQNEPDCAVRNAGVDERRLENYFKLKRELTFLERQADFKLELAVKKKWKAIEKEVRRHPKRINYER
jgi:ribosome biogenesis GTPase / thiamine phosphate phosphatase